MAGQSSNGLSGRVSRAISGRQPSGSQSTEGALRLPPISSPPAHEAPVPTLGEISTGPIPNSAWSSENFMFGVAMIIIQQNTHKIVMVHDTASGHWFFPRGRKDRGESLEQAALREAYEESGYRAQFMPHHGHTYAPITPPVNDPRRWSEPHCEPMFITTMYWPPRRRRSRRDGTVYTDTGGEYLITWYLGEIPENAEREAGTGMPDEQNYQAHLLTIEQALKLAPGKERNALVYAWTVYQTTLEIRQRENAASS